MDAGMRMVTTDKRSSIRPVEILGIFHPSEMLRSDTTAPPTIAQIAAEVRGTPDELVFEQILTGNMKDLVEHFFENELVRTSFTHAHDAGDIRAPGSIMAVAYHGCYQFSDPRYVGIPRGGMGAITQAMARAAQSVGVEIRTGAEIDRITVRKRKATGVELAGGESMEADVVVSNADPKRTFLKLVDGTDLDARFVRSIQQLKTRSGSLKFHCILRELPDLSAYLGKDFDPVNLAHVRICPSVEYFERCWEDARRGKPPSCPQMTLQIPTVYDPTTGPPGQYIMSAWVLYAPV